VPGTTHPADYTHFLFFSLPVSRVLRVLAPLAVFLVMPTRHQEFLQRHNSQQGHQQVGEHPCRCRGLLSGLLALPMWPCVRGSSLVNERFSIAHSRIGGSGGSLEVTLRS
jgi:hypothetical protein